MIDPKGEERKIAQIRESERVKAILDAERRALEAEDMALNDFILKKEEVEAKKDKLGFFKLLYNMPFPRQMISTLFALIVCFLGIVYWPVLGDVIVKNWITPFASGQTLFMILLMFDVVFLGMLVIVFTQSGQALKPFLKANLLKKPLLALMTDNNTLEFIVPKKVGLRVWEIGKSKYPVLPDPDAVVHGPNRVPILFGLPGSIYTFNPRHTLQGVMPKEDMTSVKAWAVEQTQEALDKERTGVDTFIRVAPWILGMIVVAAIFTPMAWGAVGSLGDSQKWQNAYENCRVELLDNNIIPEDLKDKNTTLPSQKKKDDGGSKPSFAGLSLK